MTKICPNCGTENQDSSEFCQNCGNKMEGTVKTSQPNKSTKTGFMGWWDKQTKGIKALSIIGVCCLGLIVIAAIGGTLLPDKTTPTITNTTPQNTTTQTQSATNNGTFENQYISFQVPSGYTVQPITNSDASNNIMDIGINKDGNLVGEVMYFENQPADIARMKADPSYVSSTIAGKDALESSDSAGLDGWILLGTTSKGLQKYVNFEVDPDQTALYQKIKSTIVIKQTFPDEST